MPEGGFQFNSLTYAVMALRVHFQHRQDVYVAGNMLIYDVEGDRQSPSHPMSLWPLAFPATRGPPIFCGKRPCRPS